MITLVATVVSGLVPAFLSSRGNAAEMMKEGGRGNSSRLVNVITRVLVVGQIALTAALLIAATLQIKSIRNQTKLDYGYDENGLYAARMALMEGAYPTEDSRREFFKRAVRALRTNPQFEAAAMTDRFRMTFRASGQYEVDGQNYLTDRDRPRGNFESVSDSYFATLGLKILEGRDFTIDDTDSKQPVAIVNASFARKYWGNQSALGHQVRIFNPGKPQAVAHDRRRRAGHVDAGTVRSTNRDRRILHAAARRDLPATQFATIVVRPRAGAARRHARARAEQSRRRSSIPNLPTYFPGTPAQFHNEILSGNRVIATLFTIFGVVAFILSGVGLYGVMSFSVNQRTQEFGIRMALGADATRIFRMVMTPGRVATRDRSRPRRRRRRAASRRRRRRGVEKHSLQGQRARSDDLFRGRRACSPWSRRCPVSFRRVAPPASIRWSRCVTNNFANVDLTNPTKCYEQDSWKLLGPVRRWGDRFGRF